MGDGTASTFIQFGGGSGGSGGSAPSSVTLTFTTDADDPVLPGLGLNGFVYVDDTLVNREFACQFLDYVGTLKGRLRGGTPTAQCVLLDAGFIYNAKIRFTLG